MADANKELRKEIANAFRRFSMDPHHSPLRKQKDREMAGRFIDRIHSSECDASSLPYYSRDGLARNRNKAECVLALMCDIVIAYWVIAAGTERNGPTDLPFILSNKLKRLHTVYENYDSLRVIGDSKGYCLFANQRPDLFKKKEVTNGSEKIEGEPASEEAGQEKVNEGIDGTTSCEETQVE